MKKTKIICTMGPSINKIKILIDLLNFGVNAIRLNFSHGNHIIHKRYIEKINLAKNISGKDVSLILDTKGPEIRTLKLSNSKEIYLNKGQIFCFIYNKNFLGNNKIVSVSYKNFINDLNINDIILVDDGLISMKVIKKEIDKIICKVNNSGFLGENKGINIPGVKLDLPILSSKDKKDLIFACNNDITFIAASFIRRRSDVLNIRKFLDKNNGKNIKIISKIENKEGLKNFNKILDVSDGIMVARGDLGVEIPIEKVIFVQKMIIKKCNYYNKIVITATQMLESMLLNPRPTRAEAGDVANAILDGTDAVMLSGESAKGKYPIEAVKIMCKICEKTDNFINKTDNYINNNYFNKNNLNVNNNKILYKSAVDISKELNSSLILVFTRTGKSSKYLRKYFPKSLILSLTTNYYVYKQLSLVRGVIPVIVNSINSIDDFYLIGKKLSISLGYAKIGDIIIIISGSIFNNKDKSISIHKL